MNMRMDGIAGLLCFANRRVATGGMISKPLMAGCLLALMVIASSPVEAATNASAGEGPTTTVIEVDHGRLTTDTLATHDRTTTGDMILRFSNMRTDDGVARFGLFADDEGWPAEWTANAMAWGKASIVNGQALVIVRNLPRGRYGMNGYHDENNNNELDSGFLGIPKEGYCFSTNYRPRFSAPDFNDVDFVFTPDPDTGAMTILIEMQYR